MPAAGFEIAVAACQRIETMAEYQEIFSTLQIKGLKLRNRVVVPPMVQVRPITSPEGIAWYRRLSEGGAGLVVVEATSIQLFGKELTAAGLRPLVEAINDEGAAAAIQLFPIPFGEEAEPGHLGLEQIKAIVRQYGQAAGVCQEAGFNGVEPHGAHGFILNQFFMPDKNHRGDQYGGSLENRARLAVEVVGQIRQTTGNNLLILYRHTPVGQEYGIDESLGFAQWLIDAGVDILDISPARDDRVADLAQPFTGQLETPVIAVGGMEDPGQAARALREGRCDLIAVGRQLIADAQWPQKVQEGRLTEIRGCRKFDDGCHEDLDRGRPVRCVQWEQDELEPYLQ